MSKTGVIMLITMIVLGIYDFWAFLIGGEYSTISRVMKDSGLDAPAIILVLGYLLGHWFSPLSNSDNTKS
jgi:hypothetical protein